jgi:hypothetical protein
VSNESGGSRPYQPGGSQTSVGRQADKLWMAGRN